MKYTTEHNAKGGFRFDISNPPAPGSELTTKSGELVIFDEVGMAGMLVCTRKSDNFQQLHFPHDFQ